MNNSSLLKSNLRHYWRTNLAMLLGVAAAVAVLAGALLVGDSVKASLRDLFVQRLGNTDYVISSQGFFREQLASDLQLQHEFAGSGFSAAGPLIALEGSVTNEMTKQVGSRIRVYGVDERFWKFHGRANVGLQGQETFLSESLARELNARPGESIVLRVEKPSAIPIESLHSRKEDLGVTLRLTVKDALTPDALGEFSLQPQQGTVRAAFVPLNVLQKELGQEGKANLILVDETVDTAAQANGATSLQRLLKHKAALEDYGIKLRVLPEANALSVESSGGLVPENLTEKVSTASLSADTSGAVPYLSYLINGIRKEDGRELPYSIITGLNSESFEMVQRNEAGYRRCEEKVETGETMALQVPPIVLNQWAGSDLQARVGDKVTLDYYVWLDEGKLATRSAQFLVACIVPMEGLAIDRDLVPDYPGITESETVSDWDPPFPIDLKRIRPEDEDYWKNYRTSPKGFIPLPVAQSLWESRFGKLTSLRVQPKEGRTVEQTHYAFAQSLRAALEPGQSGFSILPVRAQGLTASRGATDFGEYFLYFSFFLVVSALMLTALFFKLGVEQRLREIGLLQAIGFPPGKIRRLFLLEGVAISIVGGLLGIAGALAYGQLMMFGLRTWWVDAVGTTMLRLHVSPFSLTLGAIGGVLAAVICVVVTLRRLGKQSARSLLAGVVGETRKRLAKRRPARRSVLIGTIFGIAAVSLLTASALNVLGQVAGFFGGGTLLLISLLAFQSAWLRSSHHKPISGAGWWPVSRLGFRSATARPGRSVLCIALIASAAFIIVAVDAFRHREGAQALDKASGNGGYPLLAESLLPIVHDLNSREGREALSLTSEGVLANTNFARFRVRPGDDASCLNLYQPTNPKILAATSDFIASDRFAFQSSVATNAAEQTNPWLLLNQKLEEGVVPVIADANSMTYVLHRKLGDEIVLSGDKGPVRLRLVAALTGSVFQSELLMSEENFVRLFPEQQGHRFFLIDTAAPSETTATLEDRLADFGFDVVPTAERLSNFHRVENTYLSTFQMLGGLGLLLGTLGMATVLLRNVLERRRELALLRAVGYNSGHFTLMVIAENALLLLAGLLTGCFCAALAIAPVLFSRQAQLPGAALGLLLIAVLLSGLAASTIATWAALRSPLLPALRAE